MRPKEPAQAGFAAHAPLLAALGREHVAAIASLGVARTYPAGARIFEQGDPGDGMYVIVQGRVRVLTTARDGDEFTFAVLGPGEALGELAVIDGQPRSASAIAETLAATVWIPRSAFLEWLRERPAAAEALLRTLVDRLRRTDEAYADVVLTELPERLARRLLALSAERRSDRIDMRQQDLASLLGVTREAVNKCLRSLVDRGAISVGRGSVIILDRERLNR